MPFKPKSGMDKNQDLLFRVRVVSEAESLMDGESYIDLTYLPFNSRGKWHTLQRFLWDTVDKSPLERQFLWKLDWFLLTSACAGYFIKTLNASNIGTAYINGMKEYYGMGGNDYNALIALWTVGYVIGQMPSNIILHRLSARYYLCCLELTWALLTLSCVLVTDIRWLYLLRFLTGLTESGYFPGMEYLLGSWYSKEELTKRSTLFSCSGTFAGLISGPLQQWILTSDWSQSTLRPFQWMFVLDCAISVPVAIYTLFVIPDTPSTTNAWYFTRLDKLVALERRRLSGAQLNHGEPFTWKKIQSFHSWHLYVFPLLFLAFNNSGQPGTSQTFQLWMKMDLKMDSSYYNTIPSIVSLLSMAVAISVAYVNDMFQLHAFVLYIMFMCTIVGCTILAIWDVPLWLHWSAYFIRSVAHGYGQPVIFTWVNSTLAHDDMKRNFVVVLTNTMAYVTSVWVPMLTFNQQEAPRFHTGFVYTIWLGFLGMVMTTLALRWARKY